MDFLLSLLTGTATGMLSAFGVGGGTLLLLYLSVFANVSQQTAQAINLLYFLPVSFVSLPIHAKNGFLDRQALLPAICCGLLTTALFAWIATGLNTALLRRIFGGFLLLVGISQLLPSKSRKSKGDRR